MSPDTLSLHGKVAIVTGSGRENGIGAGIALALARNGADVAVNYVTDSIASRAENVAQMLREAGGRAIVVKGSVETVAGAKHLISETLAKFETDHIDILVNNGAVGTIVNILSDLDEKAIEQTAQTNINGPLYMVNAVVPHMPPGGRIINITSTQAKLGSTLTEAYAASKAALENLTWSWAKSLGRSKGITVNSVAPGPVYTDIIPTGYATDLMQPEIDITRAANRAGTQADIGDAVLLLVNEKARWITGQNIGVNGGVTR